MNEQVDVLAALKDARTCVTHAHCQIVTPTGTAESYDAAIAAVAALFAERDALREALDWYAKQAELCRKIGGLGDAGRHALDADGGRRAHAALAIGESSSGVPFEVIATFRCEENGIVGTTSAKVHSVTRHDDGVVEVLIDHWPNQPARGGRCELHSAS